MICRDDRCSLYVSACQLLHSAASSFSCANARRTALHGTCYYSYRGQQHTSGRRRFCWILRSPGICRRYNMYLLYT